MCHPAALGQPLACRLEREYRFHIDHDVDRADVFVLFVSDDRVAGLDARRVKDSNDPDLGVGSELYPIAVFFAGCDHHIVG